MKKSVSRFVPLLILCSLLVTLPKINIVKASGTIYIGADGSVEGTDRIQRDGNVYTLTDDISDSIVVERDDIVVDGAGYTLQAIGAWESPVGIRLHRRSNVTIKNMKIKDFLTSMLYDSSDNNEICGNHITNSWDGIRITYSSNNSIHGNNITHNGHGIVFYESSNNIIYHNNFMDNTEQVLSYDSTVYNVWDDGPGKGNYWSDYEERYPDAKELDDLGIWDTPYEIDENNQDNYPLMNQWIPPSQHSEPFPITWIVATIAIIAAVAASLLVYFVKVKKTTGKAE